MKGCQSAYVTFIWNTLEDYYDITYERSQYKETHIALNT
jgi:hypothetical protein